jgi:hypothetical protein
MLYQSLGSYLALCAKLLLFLEDSFWHMPYFANLLQDSLCYLIKNNFLKKHFPKILVSFFNYLMPNLTPSYSMQVGDFYQDQI